MTTKNLDRRHPLVKMVEHSYLTLKREKKEHSFTRRARNRSRQAPHPEEVLISLLRVRKCARMYGERLHEYEHAMRLVAAYFRLDSSLERGFLADALVIAMIGEAQKSIGQGLAATKSNKSRRKELNPEAYNCVTEAFIELCYRNEKPPGAQTLMTHAKQLMAKRGIPRSERDLLTRYRASELIKSIAETDEHH